MISASPRLSGGLAALMGVVSVLIHGALWAAVSHREVAPQPTRDVAEFEIVHREPPALPPTPEPPAPASRAIAPTLKLRRAPALPPARPPSAEAPPAPAAPETAQPPIQIGISLSSTTVGGSFSLAVGNTLYGKADAIAADPHAGQPYAAQDSPKAPFVPPSRVTTLPRLLDQPKPEYPPEAKKQGIEGQVVLLLTIDERGRVTRVRLVSGRGFCLDEVAQKGALAFRFAPATVNGEAVSTEIRYVYTFLLE